MSTIAVTAPAHGAVMRSQKDIQSLLDSDQFRRAVAMALPKHLTPDRFIRVALTAMMRTPKLRQCTQESLFKCLLDLSMLGLEPDGRRAHLIPYGQECTLIVDYKGIAELVRRSGDVSYIHADVVYEKDEFEYVYGSGACLTHRPNMEDRGKNIRGFYSFVKLKDGSEDFLVMSKADVDRIRARSKAANSGPWVTDYDEMGKKTAFRRHSKWLPLSPETRDAVEGDDDVIDMDLSDTPDGDPVWLQTGTDQAAREVAEKKIAVMKDTQPAADPPPEQATQADPAPTVDQPPADLPDLPDWPESPTQDWYRVQGIGYRFDLRTGNYARWDPPATQEATPAPKPAAPRQKPVFGRRGQ